jgi:hypothetical protein
MGQSLTSSHFDHIHPAEKGVSTHELRNNYPVNTYPRDLENKVFLLRNFENYMLDRLFGDQDYTFVDRELTRGMVFIQRYLRMKHVILFRLSNDVLQVSLRVLSTCEVL